MVALVVPKSIFGRYYNNFNDMHRYITGVLFLQLISKDIVIYMVIISKQQFNLSCGNIQKSKIKKSKVKKSENNMYKYNNK